MTAPNLAAAVTRVKDSATSLARHASGANVRRQRAPWTPASRHGKLTLFVLAPILDPHDNYPSGPRCMAWWIALLASKHEMSATLAVPLLTVMWGYSAWKDYQARVTSTLSATQNIAAEFKHDVTEHVEHTITEVRGPAGEPMTSLPPVPGAKTPSGEE